jgi:hypothetical protein
MGIKGMRQPNLAVAHLREVAIGEDGPGQIAGRAVHRLSRDVTQLLLHQASLSAREIEEAAAWMVRTIARCAPGGTMSAPGGRRHTGAK